MNNCQKCGKNCMNEYCFSCKPRKKLKSSGLNKKHDIIKSISVPNAEGVYNNLKMRDFFLSIWKTRPHVSEISGEKLIGEPKSYYFHHIILKSDSKYGKFAIYDEEDVILVTWEEHQNVHINPNRYEIINERREQLINKYERGNQ